MTAIKHGNTLADLIHVVYVQMLYSQLMKFEWSFIVEILSLVNQLDDFIK